jgi:hypothetical protein
MGKVDIAPLHDRPTSRPADLPISYPPTRRPASPASPPSCRPTHAATGCCQARRLNARAHASRRPLARRRRTRPHRTLRRTHAARPSRIPRGASVRRAAASGERDGRRACLAAQRRTAGPGQWGMGWGTADCRWGATPLGPRAALTERRAPERPRLVLRAAPFIRGSGAHGWPRLGGCSPTAPTPRAPRPAPHVPPRAIARSATTPGTESVRVSGPRHPALSDHASGYPPGTASVKASGPFRTIVRAYATPVLRA